MDNKMDGPTHEAMRKSSIPSDGISPEHYSQFEIEPFDFIHKNGLGFAEGNVIKYVCRWREKNGVEDLKKAIRYIELLIEEEGGI